MEAEGRHEATADEQETLSHFTGWGQFPQLFNEYAHEWRKEREQIKSVMSDEELQDAKKISGSKNEHAWQASKRATLNSHFTSPQVVDAHWKAAQKLGFKGGRYLEPSIGSGYYLGMMPEELAKKTSVTGIELDKTTAAIAQKLYPAANIRQHGFEEFEAPDNFFDLAASNVPFGNYGLHEKRYNKHQARIHDHFFLKSLDKVRPGGLVMHVTSAGTLDKKNAAIRKELAKQADLVAAIRFPGGTHGEAANTAVVTDLVILRKRTADGEAPEETPDDVVVEPGFTGTLTDSLGRVYHFVNGERVANDHWTETTTVPDPAGGEPIPVNQYFANNPDQILGTLDRTGKMRTSDSMNVTPPDDFQAALDAAIDRLPADVYRPGDTNSAPLPELATTDVKNGTLSIRDGEAVQYRDGAYHRIEASELNQSRIAHADTVRNTLRELISTDLSGQASDELRVRLNDHYDRFVDAHGALHATGNIRTLAGDPDLPLLLSLEKWDNKTKTATKADIFTRNTIRPDRAVDRADSVAAGVGITLNETGAVDVQRIAELTDQHTEDVEDELRHSGIAFEDPGAGWQSRAEYLSGNVRRKLELAKVAAAQDERFAPNVAALEAHQPKDIEFDDISARLGAPWVPSHDMGAFAASLLNGQANDFDIRYVEQTGEWVSDFAKGGNRWLATGQAAAAWGTPHKSFMQLLDAALNNKTPNVYEKDVDGKRRIDRKATDDARGKIQDMRDAFADWLWSDDSRRERLHRYYNDNFNNIRPMEYDGSHLAYPGMTPDFNMRPVQDNFVWQAVTRGKGVLAHEVGIGKTSTMVATAMELRRLGLARKPAIVCLKANLEQLTAEAQELYPGARILSTSGNFTAKKRKEMVSRIATGDYDMVFMSQDHLNMLPMSNEVQQQYITQEIEELEAAASMMATDDKSKNSRAVKALEKRKATLEARLKKAIDSKKDDQVTFEETGIDFLLVDEAHTYKNLPIYTSMQELQGVSSRPSDRATNMLMRTRWLQEQNNGRGVVFATGTPVSNSMAEMYNLQRYIQPEELEARGLKTFDAWANTFGEFEAALEPDLKGGYKNRTRFSKFVNIPELMQIARQDLDVRRVDNLFNEDGSPVVPRPNRRDHMVVTPAHESIKDMMADIKSRAQAIEGKRPGGKGEDNPLSITTAGRQGSVDARLYDPNAEDHPDSKVNKMVRNVLDRYKDGEFDGQAQLIFSDIGVHPNPSTGFHLYGDIIDKLVAGGIPREEIADFGQLEGKARLEAAAGLRSGKVRIGIGSTERMGTGLNVQTRLSALHHIDIPYKPAAFEQRNGRGHRFGNKNESVDIYNYVGEGSLDEMSWGIVSRKANFIRQAVTDPTGGKRQVTEEDAEALTPQQLMAAASGDVRILERVNLKDQVQNLRRQQSRHARDQASLKERITQATQEISTLHTQAEKATRDSADVSKEFRATINGQSTTNRAEANDWLVEAAEAADHQQNPTRTVAYYHTKSEPVWLGVVRGMNLYRDDGSYTLEGPSGEHYRTGDSLLSIENVIRNLPKRAETLRDQARQTRGDIETIKKQIGKPFSRAAELKQAQESLAMLEKELKGDNALKNNAPAETDTYSRQGGLFDESKHPRDEGGKFSSKPGPQGEVDEITAKTDNVSMIEPDIQPSDEISPRFIKPLNPVVDQGKFKSIQDSLHYDKDDNSIKWIGRPVLVRPDSDGWAALTGSHRIHAVESFGDSDLTVPVFQIENDEHELELDGVPLWEALDDARDDEDRARTLKRYAAEYPELDDAASLMSYEIEANERADSDSESSEDPPGGPTPAPIASNLNDIATTLAPTKPAGVAGQQMGLFHGNESSGEQKTLFNVVKPHSRKLIIQKVQASLLEKIEDDLKASKKESLDGQRELFSRIRAGMNRFFIEHYDRPGQRDLFSGQERRSPKTQGKMKWITIGGHPDGSGAQHAGGNAVKIDGDGKVVGGNVPKSWQGKHIRTAASDASSGARGQSAGNVQSPQQKPAQQQGQPVTLGVKQLGGRWYAMATLPDGRQVTRSHQDRDQAVKLGHNDIEKAGHHVGGEQSHLKGLWNTMKKGEQATAPDAAEQQGAQPGSTAAATPKQDTSPGGPDYGWEDPPFEQMPGLTPEGRKLEQKTQERARKDWVKLRGAYIDRYGAVDENGELSSITLNTDEWRDLFPEYVGTNAAEVHEACSYLNKRLLNEALHTLRGKGNNTILTLAGGGGSGKGTATRKFLGKKKYPIILDQVSDKVTKSFKAIDQAKDHGFSAEIMYVDREPADAFRNGVRSRALHSREKGQPARTVPVDIALKANIAARNAMVELIESNPDAQWSVINNNNGFGLAQELTGPAEAVQFLQRQQFDLGYLQEAMENDTKRLHERGEIPDDIALGLLPGHAIENGRLQPRRDGGSDSRRPENESDAGGSVRGTEDQGATHGAAGGRGAESAGSVVPKPGTDGFMKISDLKRDPERFQYKQNTNAKGVTNQFDDVSYNPMLGGKLAVWQDPENGESYVVNGHHRHELAERSGYDGQVTVHHIDAKDHKAARAAGALINIAGGNGTAVDAAKFMRDTGTTIDEMASKGVSVSKGLGRDAVTLSKLSPRLFDKLSQGLYRQGRALAIAQHLHDHEDQERVDKLIEQRESKGGRTIADSTVSEIARQAAVASRKTEVQGGLFGDEVNDRNLFVERAELVSGLRRQMTERLNKFKAVATDKAASTLKGHNTIDAEANRSESQKLSQLLSDFNRESTYSGPVSDIINQAAEELADAPGRKTAILKRLASDINEHFAVSESQRDPGPDGTESGDPAGGIEERQPYTPAPGQKDFFSRRRSGLRPTVAATSHRTLASTIACRLSVQ